jgi:hypothetical protein
MMGKKKDLTELFFFTKFQYKLTVCINLNGERGPNPWAKKYQPNSLRKNYPNPSPFPMKIYSTIEDVNSMQ